MKIQTIESLRVEAGEMVRIKIMGNIIEIMYSDNYKSRCTIKRLDADTYVDLKTGKIKKFKHIDNRGQDKKGVSKSLIRVRDIINTNITDVANCRWLTLTYRDNMTDPNKLQSDFKNFNTRLRAIVGAYEYIVVMEPQGRGAWHAHVVLIFDHKAPYIPNDTVWACWSPKGFKARLKDGKGYDYVKTKKLDNVDNVGAYLTAYLGDIDLDDINNGNLTLSEAKTVCGDIVEKEVENEQGEKIKKSYIKGGRLGLYPPKFNLYRCSKGIKKPIVYYDSEAEAQKKVSAATLTFEKTIQLSDLDSQFTKTINYRYYNKARKNKQQEA